MRLPRIFGAKALNARRSEPAAHAVERGDPQASARRVRIDDDARANDSTNPVLDLLGDSADANWARYATRIEEGVPPTEGAAGARLMSALYEQYCQALDAPLSGSAGEWVGATDVADALAEDRDRRERGEGQRGQRGDSSSSPIAAILGDIHNVQQAFGPLARMSAEGIAEADEVPEVLRLFAPPEYHAAAARRVGAMPPSLVRREHHTLAIDSPIRPLNIPNQHQEHPE
jgi:hypothetical protein